MSWWETSSFSALAANAIKTAQKKIDKVLDIKDEDGTEKDSAASHANRATAIEPAAHATHGSKASDAGDNFWDTWLSPAQQQQQLLSDAPREAGVTKPAAAGVSTLSSRKSKASAILPSRSAKTSKQTHDTSSEDGAANRAEGTSALSSRIMTILPVDTFDGGPAIDSCATTDAAHLLTAVKIAPAPVEVERVETRLGGSGSMAVAAVLSSVVRPDVSTVDNIASVTGVGAANDAASFVDTAFSEPPAQVDAADCGSSHVDAFTSKPEQRPADRLGAAELTVEALSYVEELSHVPCCAQSGKLGASTALSLPAPGDDTVRALPCTGSAGNQGSDCEGHISSSDSVSFSEPAFLLPDCDHLQTFGDEQLAEAGEATGLIVAQLHPRLEQDASRSEISSSSTTSLATVAEACPDEGGNMEATSHSSPVTDVTIHDTACLLQQSIDDMVIVEHEACSSDPNLGQASDAHWIDGEDTELATGEGAVTRALSCEQVGGHVETMAVTLTPDGTAGDCIFNAASPDAATSAPASSCLATTSNEGTSRTDSDPARKLSTSDDAHRFPYSHSRNSSFDIGNSSPGGALSDRNCTTDDMLDVETGTSSDIEIISMSTHSESNGDARLVDFVHGGSMARSIFKTKMRELSPETSSESGSNGSQASPPCVRDDMSDPLLLMGEGSEASHLKAFPATAKRDAAEDPLDSQALLKKLSHLAEVLEARESKILIISKENADLHDVNSHLKGKIEALEEGNVAVENLKEEFGQRLSEMERRQQAAVREKDMLKKQLSTALEELSARSGSSQAMEHMLREKDEQINSLLQEGEKLSKQQLQGNNIIKKLRSKEKENDELLKSQRDKLDAQKKEIERLQAVLDSKIDNEKQHSDTIKQLNSAAKKYQDENARMKTEADDHQEKLRSMQSALDSSYKEIAELLKVSASKESRVQELALSAELQAKEELRLALDKLQRESSREAHTLAIQVEDLQLAMARAEKDHTRREAGLREEVAELQQRLQEADTRSGDLTRNIALSTRPLLRQIENLQSAHSAQSEAWERLERNLTERLAEAQSQIAGFAERERTASDRAIDAVAKVSALESQCSLLKQERMRLVAEIDTLKARVELLEDDKSSAMAQHVLSKQNLEREVGELKKEKVFLENQLEMEKVRAEGERKKCNLLQDQLREKEQQLSQLSSPALRGSPAPTASLAATPSRESGPFVYRQDDILERALQTPVLFGGNASGSLYESMRQSGASALVENLEAQLKCREGEVLQLQRDFAEVERSREAVMTQLVQLTNAHEKLQLELLELPRLRIACQDLDQRCNALLQMYGEKVEEANELRMDLQDVKEMYKNQIDILVAKSHR